MVETKQISNMFQKEYIFQENARQIDFKLCFLKTVCSYAWLTLTSLYIIMEIKQKNVIETRNKMKGRNKIKNIKNIQNKEQYKIHKPMY